MWIRTAYWIGRAKAGEETRFRALIDGTLVPAIRGMPGVRSGRAMWPMRREDGSPPLACQILVEFDDRDAVDRMLGSVERQAMREHVMAILPLFDGSFSHIDCEVS